MSTEQPLKSARSEIDCEDDLQAWIERGMESNGWTVLREVTARHSNYRADIVAKRKDIGPIGIECKYVTGGPTVASKAASQICNRYASEKFFQWDIDMWAVCLFGRAHRPQELKPDRSEYEKERHYENRRTTERVKIYTVQRMLNGLGIGYVNASANKICLEFAPSTPELRIPLFTVGDDFRDDYIKTNVEKIQNLIDDRRPV